MCDIALVVQADRVLFAKNSDRDPNEAQALEWHPRDRHPPGSTVACTWVRIPQVPTTAAVLLSRPFWMWGAEMGANEHGVVVGNVAVFTRRRLAPTGLTGMDLVRLALERSTDARSAVAVIVELLERHGQGGGCGHEDRAFTYHNSFAIADAGGAYVLETADRDHRVQPVTAVHTLSNGLTLPGFAERHSDWLKTSVSRARSRRARTASLADAVDDVGSLFRLLRDHGAGSTAPRYAALNGALSAPCVHAGGWAVGSQTTASWVSELTADGVRHWATGTAAPCVGLFKPVAIDRPVAVGPSPDDRADSESLWWRHERLHRRLLRADHEIGRRWRAERDVLEAAWLERPPSSAEAFAAGDALLGRGLEATRELPATDRRPFWARRYWRRRDRRCGLAGPVGGA